MPIDPKTKLFGQLLLDPELQVSPLEGNTIQKVAESFYQFLDLLESKSASSSLNLGRAIIPTDLSTQEEFKALKKHIEILKGCSQDAMTITRSILKEELVYIPGGYIGHMEGHAMIYQISKAPDGGWIFLVYNSGEGNRFHNEGVNSQGTKHLHEPLVAYRIPADLGQSSPILTPLEKEQRLGAFIKALLNPQRRDSSTLGAQSEHLYQVVFEKVRYLGGSSLDPRELKASGQALRVDWLTPQRSGTCCQKSLNQMIKAHFSQKGAGKALMYAYKLHYLETYISDYISGQKPIDSERRAMIRKAIANLARGATEELGKMEIRPEIRKGILAFLNVQKKNVEQLTLQPSPSSPPALPTLSSIEMKVSGFRNLDPSDRKGSHLPPRTFRDKRNLREALAAIDDKQCNPYESLKRAFIEKFTVEEKNSALTQSREKHLEATLTDLQKALHIIKNNTRGKISPQSYPMIFALIVHTLRELGTSTPPLKYPPLRLWAPFLWGYLWILKKVPHLASASPEMDHLLNEVEQTLKQQPLFYPSSNPSNSKNFARYYVQWIPTSERARLLTLYKDNQADFHKKMMENIRWNIPDSSEPATPFNPESWCEGDDNLRVFLAYRILDSKAMDSNSDLKERGLQYQYEAFIRDCLSMITDWGELQTPVSPVFQVFKNGIGINSVELKSLGEMITGERSYDRYLLKKDTFSNYRIDDPVFRRALEDNWSKDYDSHFQEISAPQSSSHQIQYQWDSSPSRDLKYSRRNVDSELENVLGYYALHLSLLDQRDHKTFLFLSLFQHSLLFQKLADEEQGVLFLKEFQKFLRVGLVFFEQGHKGSDTQRFLLKCAAQVYHYAHYMDLPPKVRREAAQQLTQLQATLKTQLKQHPQPGIPRVELLRLMVRTELNSDAKTQSLEKLKYLIELQIQINQAHTPKSLEIDNLNFPAEKEENAYFASRILQVFQDDPRAVSQHLPDLLKKYFPKLVPYSFTVSLDSFPLCSLEFKSNCSTSYTFDLNRGELIEDNQSLRPLPFSLVSHPDYQEILGENESDDSTFFILQNFYAFKHREREYRAQDSNPPLIQVKIEGEWYTLQNKESVKSSYVFGQQSHIRWWFNQNSNGYKGYAQDLRTHQYIYQYEENNGTKILTALSKEGIKEGIIENNTLSAQRIQKTLSAVEHQRFIEVIDMKGPSLSSSSPKRVRLRRYGMEFQADEKGNLRYSFEGRTYGSPSNPHMVKLAREQLAGLEALVLEEETKSQGTNPPEIRLWIPFQPFSIAQDEKDKKIIEGLHYQLIPDHNHRLKSLHFGKDHKPNWHYDQTERMISFTLENGKLKAHSTEDQLYLVYLYLCQGREDLADQALREIQLIGTAKELECTFLILKHFPSKEGKNQENPQLANPIQLAVKTRLLWMLAQLGEGSKTPIALPSPHRFVVSDDQSVYARDYHQALADFYKNLPETLASNYTSYLDVLNNIPPSFRLNKVQEHQLLSYYILGHDQLMGKDSNSQTLSACLYEAKEHSSFSHSLMAWRWANFQLRVSRDSEDKSQLQAIIDKGVRVEQGKVEDLTLILEPFPDTRPKMDRVLDKEKCTIRLGESEWNQIIGRLTELECAKGGRRAMTLQDLSMNLSLDQLKTHYSDFYHALLKPSDEDRQKTLLFLEAALRHCALVPQEHPEQEKLPFFYLLWILAKTPNHELKNISEYRSCYQENKRKRENEGQEGSAPNFGLSLFALIMSLCEKEKPHTLIIPQVWVKKSVFIRPESLNLPALSAHHPPQQRGEDKKALDFKHPLAIHKIEPLQNILHLQNQAAWEVKQLQEKFEQNPSSNIYEEFDREKKAEDQVAQVIFESQKQIDQQIDQFFSQHWNSFLKVLKDAQLGPEQAAKKKVGARAKLEALFSHELIELKSEEAHLQELGELSESKDLEKILALAILVERGDPQALTQISVEKRSEFLSRVRAYLNAHFEEQWLIKLCQKPEKELPAQRAWIKSLLDYNVSKTLETDILQYAKGIALYSEQQAHLDHLLGLVPLKEKTEEKTTEPAARTVHMPMGGGKTALIIPTLAYAQATGKRLVIVQVPPPLLNSVYIDLSRTSNQVFGQTPLKLEFDRNSNCSPKSLYRFLSLMEQAILYRQYIVTTKSTRDAFHMKLQELWLIAHEAKDKKASNLTLLNEQIRILQRINKMLNEAYAIIDEAHETYAIKEETRYTFGQELPLPSEQIQDLMQLFESFFQFKPSQEDKSFGERLAEGTLISVSEQELEQQFKEFFDEKLYEESFLVKEEKDEEEKKDKKKEEKSSLKTRTEKTSVQEDEKKGKEKKERPGQTETRNFVFFEAKDLKESKDSQQQSLSDPNALPRFLTASARQRAWLYREIFQKFLAYAAHKKLFVEYGPPRQSDQRFASGLAVPFKANNVPSPNQFSNYLETAILTIFMVYAQGVNRYFFDQLIHYYKKKDREERLEKLSQSDSSLDLSAERDSTERTEAEKQFFTLFEVELAHQDPLDTRAMDALFDQLRRKPELILEALKNHILPKIKVHEQELVTDSVAHGALYGIRVLLSGTLRSYRTFDQQVVHKPSQTLAVNGLIRKYIVLHSDVKVQPKLRSAQDYVKSLVDCRDPHLSAVIDTGAHFDGVSNIEVAQLIAQKIREQNQEARLRWVLYYNEAGILCALSTEKPEEPPVSLRGSAEKELRNQLGEPECRFTYYDQSHTTGSDIRQPKGARAIMTVSSNTKESDFQQGAMRMRDLAGSQHLTLVITPEFNKKLTKARVGVASTESATPQELSDWTYQVETSLLIPDHQKAVQYRMKDYLRKDLSQRMTDFNSAQQGAFFALAQSFFMKKQALDYAQFHSVWSKQSSKVFLENYAQALMDAWEKTLTKGQKKPLLLDMQEKSKVLNAMIERGLKEIEGETLSEGQDLGAQAESQVQIEVRTQQETKKELTVHHPSIKPKSVQLDFVQNIVKGEFKLGPPYTPYRSEDPNKAIPPYKDKVNKDFKARLKPLDLSPQLFASPEYQQIGGKETSCFSRYTKPIQDLLWIKKGAQLKVVILIPEEAHYLKDKWNEIKQGPGVTHLWISNLAGFSLKGKPPENIENVPEYQSLREQLLFLNGDIDYLLRFKEYRWLNVDSADKIEFYKKQMSLAHLDSPIKELEERLLFSIELFRKVQGDILTKGYSAYTKSERNYPESLRGTRVFKEYLEAMGAVWKSVNSAIQPNLPLNLKALVIEYKQHLAKIEKSISARPSKPLEHLDLLFYPIPNPPSNPPLLLGELLLSKPQETPCLFAQELSERKKIILLKLINHYAKSIHDLLKLFPLLTQEGLDHDPDIFEALTPHLELIHLSGNSTQKFLTLLPESFYPFYVLKHFDPNKLQGSSSLPLKDYFPGFFQCLKNWEKAGLNKAQVKLLIGNYQFIHACPEEAKFLRSEISQLSKLFQSMPEGVKDLLEVMPDQNEKTGMILRYLAFHLPTSVDHPLAKYINPIKNDYQSLQDFYNDMKDSKEITPQTRAALFVIYTDTQVPRDRTELLSYLRIIYSSNVSEATVEALSWFLSHSHYDSLWKNHLEKRLQEKLQNVHSGAHFLEQLGSWLEVPGFQTFLQQSTQKTHLWVRLYVQAKSLKLNPQSFQAIDDTDIQHCTDLQLKFMLAGYKAALEEKTEVGPHEVKPASLLKALKTIAQDSYWLGEFSSQLQKPRHVISPSLQNLEKAITEVQESGTRKGVIATAALTDNISTALSTLQKVFRLNDLLKVFAAKKNEAREKVITPEKKKKEDSTVIKHMSVVKETITEEKKKSETPDPQLDEKKEVQNSTEAHEPQKDRQTQAKGWSSPFLFVFLPMLFEALEVSSDDFCNFSLSEIIPSEGALVASAMIGFGMWSSQQVCRYGSDGFASFKSTLSPYLLFFLVVAGSVISHDYGAQFLKNTLLPDPVGDILSLLIGAVVGGLLWGAVQGCRYGLNGFNNYSLFFDVNQSKPPNKALDNKVPSQVAQL